MRELQDKVPLSALIESAQIRNRKKHAPKPILLKIAPDLNRIQLDEVIEIVMESEIDGIIASNTSVSRNDLKTTDEELKAIGNGGLSGLPIRDKSTEVIRYLAEKSNKAFPIIGVGGIHSAQDALDKIAAGADLVQIYTGFIYEGPKLVRDINLAILNAK